MKPNPIHRLPAPLEDAIQRLKLAAREAAERTIESLGLAALAAGNAYQRDGLLGAQFELNRRSAIFALTFNEAYDQRVLREVSPKAAPEDDAAALYPNDRTEAAPAAAASAPTDWASLSLVEDKEVEAQISADRFGLEVMHACEWELRELEAYAGSLLDEAGGERDRNPLRPELVGFAMMRGINAVSERDDVRKVLATELGRSMAALLPNAYGDIVTGFRNAGIKPLSLAVRHRAARAATEGASGDSGFDPDTGPNSRGHSRSGMVSGHGPAGIGGGMGIDSRFGGRRSGPGSFAHSQRGSGPGAGLAGPRGGGTPMGQIDPGLMSLIRRLTYSDGGGAGRAYHDDGYDEGYDDPGDGRAMQLPRNVIRAHREELRQASNGALDHMVIDVIGFMFDQIMADSNVPPQLARQIARLQLPVLRAALGDRTFFSSRKHPVRRFINRIASLGSAFDDFGDEGAKLFLAKVRSLVQEVAEGDFDRIELYEQKLAALEQFTQSLATQNDHGQREAARLLAEKEDQQRLRDLYALRVEGDLKGLDAPGFLREFLAAVWSQVLLRAAERDGDPNGELTQRYRRVGRELFLSVQPKATPALRKAFLTELPRLMQELTEGMNLIAWPEGQRRDFFGKLMPTHAEALKSLSGRTLEINLMARQVEGALRRPPPSKAELASAPLPRGDLKAAALTAEEAQRVGLVQESAIDWSHQVQPQPESTAAARVPSGQLLPEVTGSTVPQEAAEPTEGRALADHVQMGYPYQMHLDGEWQKVRLSHVSTARSFFIFTHGSKQRKTISLTQRMLIKLCETGRLKAYETTYLVERATARARRQLAGMTNH